MSKAIFRGLFPALVISFLIAEHSQRYGYNCGKAS
jgi:hypothetical protein